MSFLSHHRGWPPSDETRVTFILHSLLYPLLCCFGSLTEGTRLLFDVLGSRDYAPSISTQRVLILWDCIVLEEDTTTVGRLLRTTIFSFSVGMHGDAVAVVVCVI
jgi:hypothetical protein